MTRTKLALTIVTLLFAAGAAFGSAAPSAGAATLGEQLRDGKRELRRAQARLDAAEAALAEALADHQRRGTGVLVRRVEGAQRAVRHWTAVVRELRRKKAEQDKLAALERRGAWRALIFRAAKKYGVSAEGLYRLMILESGGKVRAVSSGRFYGLYQYALGTWRGAWNPWRAQSVFDGSAQIEASAYAIKKGMGRNLWGNTYPIAF